MFKKSVIIGHIVQLPHCFKWNWRSNCCFPVCWCLRKCQLVDINYDFVFCRQTYVYGDLMVYNIKKKTWTRIQSPGAAPPRCAHQAVLTAADGGRLWIFGGEYASPSQSQFYHYKVEHSTQIIEYPQFLTNAFSTKVRLSQAGLAQLKLGKFRQVANWIRRDGLDQIGL